MYLRHLMYMMTMVVVATATNDTHSPTVIQGYEPDYDVDDIPRHLKTGRKHCFKNPHLSCNGNRKCCTHVAKKKIWCCDRSHKCGKAIKTCVVP